MRPPLFSIIIPTYNAELLLRPCLDSIICQTYISKEVIIVDSQSSDKTINIIEEYQKLFPQLTYVSEPDRGIYDGMNKGINKATGQWLYFLGSDDCLDNPCILEKIARLIEVNKKCKIIYGNVLTSAEYVQTYKNHDYNKLINLNICHQAIFYHRSIFNKHGYDLKYTICADWDLNLKVFRKPNRPLYADINIAKYNLNGASANWTTHPDYLLHFSDKKKLILRYRSLPYLLYSFSVKLSQKVRSFIFQNND